MDKKIAIMQPYLFPYLGYFQLINSVNEFIVFDDVNYMKKGWINRNNFIFNGQKQSYTFPIQKASQNKKILELFLVIDKKWKNDFLNKINISYNHSPYFYETFKLLSLIILNEEQNLSKFIINSIKIINDYLNIGTEISISSEIIYNNDLKGQDKIIELCKSKNANYYINAIGGINLYDQNHFFKQGIELKFIEPILESYHQNNNNADQFTPYLSIIDVLMNVDKENVKKWLNNFKLK